MNTSVIEVHAWGTLVGATAEDPNLRCFAFEYDPAWLKRGIELAPLTMPTANVSGPFVFPSLAASYRRLPGLVCDSLPDEFGNNLIDAWMVRHGHRVSAVTSLDRLAYMGARGLGALEFRPTIAARRESKEPLRMQRLVEAARRGLEGDFSDDRHAQAALENIIRVGTSAGGARAKAVIAWNPRSEEIRSGQFAVARGFEHWLLKFDGVGKDLALGTPADYGRIEYAYALMAGAAGVSMSACRLLEENGRAHFMTKRFDRHKNAKHHVQSLFAMSHLDYQQVATHGYEQYFDAIATLRLGDDALVEAYRRMAFNVMAANCDDHTKNFAFLLRDGGAWELSPAYDVTHAYNPENRWLRQHLMSVNGRFAGIALDDLLAVADRYGVPRAAAILGDVRAAIDDWSEFADAAQVGARTRAKVTADFRPV